jgi:hypothetical protein
MVLAFGHYHISVHRGLSSEVDGEGLNRFCKGQELSLAEWFFLGSLAVWQRKHIGMQSH